MTTPAHKPAGTPDGGQFTASAHSDVVPVLDAPVTAEHFASLMTEDLGARLDEALRGRLKDTDPDTGHTVHQDFETTAEEGALSIYTDSVAMGEAVTYTVAFRDGSAQIRSDDSFLVTAAPRTLHPDEWVTTEDAAAEISQHILDMEADIAAETGNTSQPDGFASDADFRKWKER